IRVDAVLIGVGLTPVDELVKQAERVGLPCFQAGDAQEIAEASAAFFGGKIAAAKILHHLSGTSPYSPEWESKMSVLKSRPGPSIQLTYPDTFSTPFMPVLHCYQSIPCNPCSTICPRNVIFIPEDDIMEIPKLLDNQCIGCFQCVLKCPGLAISLVKNENGRFFCYLPFELEPELLHAGQSLPLTDYQGQEIGTGTLIRIIQRPTDPHRLLLEIETADPHLAIRSAGFRLFNPIPDFQPPSNQDSEEHPDYVCRCEHITRQEIEAMIDQGITDINLMKSIHRVTMGGCGGKSCQERILAIMREKGIPPAAIIPNTVRPFLAEVKLSLLADYQENQS
ncbi:MAG: (2Fe-2S)-binding protein, partial [Candidatus Delongbacteria bacterium]|nr:(2Fe-2S)-binding protein [Candidatus Delongbacteria bacterium]